MKEISASKSFGGTQYLFSHSSEACQCDMTFAVFMPPQAQTAKVPVLWYLSGLTCTHQNVMDKGEYRKVAAELGVAIVCPDTSPRGDDIPDEPDNWQFGKGAGFYLDATQAPFATNYNMETYILEELPRLLDESSLALDGVVTLSFSGRKGQGLVDIQAKQAAIFHASKASRRW